MKKSEVYVYIAGKYTAAAAIDIDQNILDAKRIAVVLAEKQIKFYCPHTITAHFDNYTTAPWQFYMDLFAPVIRKLCNCMVMVHNWQASKGAKQEYSLAAALGYPIFYTIDEFLEWYETLPD